VTFAQTTAKLQEGVDPRVGAQLYLHDHWPDLYDLSTALLQLPVHKTEEMAALILGGGLMISPIYMRFAHWIVMKRHKVDEYQAWLHIFQQSKGGSKVAADVLLQTADRVVNGIDEYDDESMGGFCQDEINRLAWSIHLLTTLEGYE
jgi:hypothetical protein